MAFLSLCLWSFVFNFWFHMLHLNLLPPEEKLNLAYIIRARTVAAAAGGLGLALIIFMALLLPAVFLVAFQKSEVIRALEIERENQGRSGISAKTAEIQSAKRLAGIVLDHEKNPVRIYPMLEGVFRDVPAQVRLGIIRFRFQERELALEGFSPARSDLLGFIAALNQNPAVKNVSSPVTNIIKEADIKFSLTVKLK